MTDPQFVRIEASPARPRLSSTDRPVSILDPLLAAHPRLVWALVLLLTLGGGALRFYRIGDQALWYDEVVESSIASGPLNQILPRLWGHENEMPLDYYFQHLAYRILGFSESVARTPAAIFATLTIPIAFIFARGLFGATVGLIAALLLAFSPFHRHYGQEARQYALLAFLTLIACCAVWRLVEGNVRRRRTFALWAIVSLLAVWTNLFGIIALAMQVGWVWLVWLLGGFRDRGRARLALATAAVFFVAALSLIPVIGRTSNTNEAEAYVAFAPLTWEMVLRFFGGFTFGHDDNYAVGAWGTWGLIACIIGLICGFIRRPRAAGLLTLLFLGSASIILYLTARSDHWFSLRYIMIALVPYLVLVGIGVLKLLHVLAWLISPRNGQRRVRVAAALLVLASLSAAVASTIYMARHQHEHTDWRKVIAWVREEGMSDSLLLSPDGLLVAEFNFYARLNGLTASIEHVGSRERLHERAREVGAEFLIVGGETKFSRGQTVVWGLPPLRSPIRQVDLFRLERDPQQWASTVSDQITAAAASFESSDHRLDIGDESWPELVGPGWGWVEKWNNAFDYRWSASTDPVVALPLSTPRDLFLSFRATAFEYAGARPQLTIVHVNETPVAFGAIVGDWHVYGAAVSAEVWHPGPNIIRFQTDHVASPEAVGGGGDARPLGIGVDWIDLSEGREKPAIVEHEWTGAPIPADFSAF